MATPTLHPDFREFLRLLDDHEVDYLLIGGYAVAFHGYPRATGDMDIWIPREARTAEKLVLVLREFGFDTPDLREELFLREQAILRMGIPPFRIEVSNFIDGVEFWPCYERRLEHDWEGVRVPVIHLADLRVNKAAAGRMKDLDDLANLPTPGQA